MNPFHLSAGEGENLHVLGETISIKIGADETSGHLTIIEEITPPDGGPPPHVHTREDETFYVLEGECTFTVDNQTFVAKEGDFAFGPRNVPHSFKNTGSVPSRILINISPSGLEGFFRQVHGTFGEGPPNVDQLKQMAAKYGLTFV